MPRSLAALSARTGLRRVLVAYALFDVIEMYGWLVVILWAFDRGGASLAALATIVQLVPAALLAPVVAGLGDRLPRGRALVLAHGAVAVGYGLTALALAVGAEGALVIAASASLTIVLAFVRPAHFAALPQLARESPAQLVSANGLSSVCDGVARFIGPVAAGVAYARVGPAMAMAFGIVAAALATVLCLRLRLDRPAAVEGDTGLRAAVAGFRALRSDRASVALLGVMALAFVLSGSLDILGVSYADEILRGDAATAGVVIGSLGIGGLVGALIGGTVAGRRRLGSVVIGGGVAAGAAFAAVSLLGSLGVVAAALVVCGVASALTLVAGRTLLQRSTDDGVLARVFGVQESVALMGVAVGTALAPLLIRWFGQPQAWVPLGLGCALLALLGVPAVRMLDARARYLPEQLAVLRGVPFLALLPPYELERLAAHSRWREVAPGEAVVTQGEQGHEFFVIESGETRVTVDGVDRPGLLEAGDFFGEVALLHSVSRTATVSAVAPTRLLVVASADFLAAVTGHADGHAVAYETGDRYEDRRPLGGPPR